MMETDRVGKGEYGMTRVMSITWPCLIGLWVRPRRVLRDPSNQITLLAVEGVLCDARMKSKLTLADLNPSLSGRRWLICDQLHRLR